MKLLHEIPPFYEDVLTAGLKPNLRYVMFAYGDVLYVPGGFQPFPEMMAHEMTHSRQQEAYNGGKDAWWGRYLGDVYFRMDQEAEAYANQYKAYCKQHKDRNVRVRYLLGISGDLAGALYGNVINRAAAHQLIQNYL
jgi:hypothetical protein